MEAKLLKLTKSRSALSLPPLFSFIHYFRGVLQKVCPYCDFNSHGPKATRNCPKGEYSVILAG